MIVKGIILILLIFAALVFLAVKMSESIVKAELKMFFFGLFFVTILTLFNIILSAYFVIKAKDKTGPRGRKGRKGIIGDPGEDGECNESCKANSVHQMIVNKLETSDDGTKNNLTEEEMKKLCFLKEHLDVQNSIFNDNNKNVLKFLKDIKNDVTEEILSKDNLHTGDYLGIRLKSNKNKLEATGKCN